MKQFNDIGEIDKAVSTISELLVYAKFHFESESALMAKLGYFDYDGHTETHAVFLKMANELFVTLLNDLSYLPDVIRILTNWFTNHIEVEMLLFNRPFLKKKFDHA